MREPYDKCSNWRDDADSTCGYCDRCNAQEEDE